MADKTRSSIMVGVMGVLHAFNVGIVRELVSTTSNVTPDDLFQGRWLLLDMAASEFGDVGATVNRWLQGKAPSRRVSGQPFLEP